MHLRKICKQLKSKGFIYLTTLIFVLAIVLLQTSIIHYKNSMSYASNINANAILLFNQQQSIKQIAQTLNIDTYYFNQGERINTLNDFKQHQYKPLTLQGTSQYITAMASTIKPITDQGYSLLYFANVIYELEYDKKIGSDKYLNALTSSTILKSTTLTQSFNDKQAQLDSLLISQNFTAQNSTAQDLPSEQNTWHYTLTKNNNKINLSRQSIFKNQTYQLNAPINYQLEALGDIMRLNNQVIWLFFAENINTKKLSIVLFFDKFANTNTESTNQLPYDNKPLNIDLSTSNKNEVIILQTDINVLDVEFDLLQSIAIDNHFYFLLKKRNITDAILYRFGISNQHKNINSLSLLITQKHLTVSGNNAFSIKINDNSLCSQATLFLEKEKIASSTNLPCHLLETTTY